MTVHDVPVMACSQDMPDRSQQLAHNILTTSVKNGHDMAGHDRS